MMFRVSALVAGLFLLASVASAQAKLRLAPLKAHTAEPAVVPRPLPAPTPNDTLYLKTKIGSFKFVRKGTEYPNGRLDLSFTGTVLVSGLVSGSTLQTIGNIREEYDNKQHGKQVFFGKGKIVVVGQFRACQCFATDIDLTFKGSAILRITSEFDKNFDTGSYWFDDKVVNPLQVQMSTVVVPKEQVGPVKAITREQYEQMKKQQKGHS